MILKDLLKDKEEVVIELNENNRQQFLKQAKDEGFKWNSNKGIQENDECAFHISINKDGYIGNISAMCYAKSEELQALSKYQYWQNGYR